MLLNPEGAACILLVAPSSDANAAYRQALEAEGWRVLLAATAADAVAAAARARPQVAVVTDATSGGDATDLIRTLHRRCPGVLCILVANYPEPAEVVRAVQARVYGCLVHPFQPAELVALVRNALNTWFLRASHQAEIIRAAEVHTIVEIVRVVQDRINNPLQVVMGNAEIIGLSASELPDRIQHLVKRLVTSSRELGDIVQHLAQIMADHVSGGTMDLPRREALAQLLARIDEDAAELPEEPELELSQLPVEDRRSETRYACGSLMISVPDGGHAHWYYVDNISMGGVGLTLLYPESVPRRFRARLWDLDSRESVPIEVEMRWSNEGVPSAIGLRFAGTNEETRSWLEELLERLGQADGSVDQ